MIGRFLRTRLMTPFPCCHDFSFRPPEFRPADRCRPAAAASRPRPAIGPAGSLTMFDATLSPPPLRLLLVDDHRLFVHGVTLLLQARSDLLVVGEAFDGPSARQFAAQSPFDLAIMETRVADEDGIELAAELRSRHPQSRTLFLSADEDVQQTRRALTAGANGFLLKSSTPAELQRAIDSIRRGDIYLCREVTAALASGRPRAADDAPAPRISAREKDVLRLISEGLRNKEIASLLEVSTKSVETYRRRLQTKLGYASTAELIRHAIREGISPL